MSQDEDEARKHRVVAEARANSRTLGTALAIFGALQLLAAAATYGGGKLYGFQAVTLLGIMCAGPGAIVVFAGFKVRTLSSWNLAYAGLISSMGLWAFVLLTLNWVQMSQFTFLPAIMGVTAFILVVWTARKAEDPHIRAARSLVEPRGPREPGERLPF